MRRLLLYLIFFAVLGFAAAYLLVGKDAGGNYINPVSLFLPAGEDLSGFFKDLSLTIQSGFRVEEIRRYILIGGGIGGGFGLLLALTTGRRRRR